VSWRKALEHEEHVVALRLVGMRRIEMLHKGRMVLCWDDSTATWTVPKNWDEVNLSFTLMQKFCVDGMQEPDRGSFMKRVDTIARVVMAVSDAPGEGSSMVIASDEIDGEENAYPQMTDCKKGMSEGDLDTDSDQKLFDTATQDGGVFINLKTGEYKGRRQFLPSLEGQGFNYRLAKLFYNGHESLLAQLWEDSECDGYHWPDWYNVLHWGTRHLSALGMSFCFRCQHTHELPQLPQDAGASVIAVVVSADGPVTVFDHGVSIDSPTLAIRKNVDGTERNEFAPPGRESIWVRPVGNPVTLARA